MFLYLPGGKAKVQFDVTTSLYWVPRQGPMNKSLSERIVACCAGRKPTVLA